MNIKQNIVNVKGYFCQICKIYSWQSTSLTLELDHIDGNINNNELENLRLLCPNCHSQTPTWKRKKVKKQQIVSDEDLLNAIKKTSNIRQALIYVGLTPKGKNYTRISKLLNSSKQVQTNNSQYGTYWINKEGINKKIKAELLDDHLACGWIRGRYLSESLPKPPNQKGKFWITNGIQNKMISPDDDIPARWYKGKIQSS